MKSDYEKIKGFQEGLKKSLTAKEPSDAVKRLITLQTNRINTSIERRLADARAYKAIDSSYDASQNQACYTLMKDLIDSNPTVEEATRTIKAWGFNDMLRPISRTDQLPPGAIRVNGSDGKPGYMLQVPVFFNIIINLLMSYLKIRWGKLSNDRDFYPLYPYDSTQQSLSARSAAKVITSRVDAMCDSTNERAAQKEAIFKMLLYGQAITFPQEAWWSETGPDGELREGIRTISPHPLRVGFDMDHPPYTINSDSGVEWGFYWKIERYGALLDKKFWLDKGKIKVRNKYKDTPALYADLAVTPSWRTGSSYADFIRLLYPCAFSFPSIQSVPYLKNDRNTEAYVYGQDTLDCGIDQASFFQKLIPEEHDLYDYDKPVWHRFLYAGASRVIYAEPILYNPMRAYLYDAACDRARNSSLGFELMPFQDCISNAFMQQLVTVRKNLARVIAVNTDVIKADFLNKLANNSENSVRGFEFLTFSGRTMMDKEADITKSLFPLPLQQTSTSEIIGTINTTIMMLERLLGYSSQEVGSAASHQQSAQEVNLIAGATNTRIEFTGTFIDDARRAAKKQLYNAMCAYSSDEVFVELTDMHPGSKEALTKMGFDVTEDDRDPGVMSAKGKKSAVMDYTIAWSNRDGQNRNPDSNMVTSILGFLDRILSNPVLSQAVGTPRIIQFFNAVGEYVGLPKELKLPEGAQKMTEEEQAGQLKQMQEAVGQLVQQQVAPPMEKIATEVTQTQQAVEQMSQVVGQQGQAVEQISQVTGQLGQATQQQGAALQQQGEAIGQLAQRQQAEEQALKIILEKMNQLIGVAAQTPQMQPGMQIA